MENDDIKKYSELLKQPVKNVSFEGTTTIVEFENGQILPLYGGGYEIENMKRKIYYCSFCGHEGTDENPVVSLNEKNDPVVCAECAVKIVESFLENGIEIKFDLSRFASEETLKSLNNLFNGDK